MRYWWVNQNQAFQHEVPGGYLWSPKKNSNGRLNPFYEFMKEVSAGDMIFSFADTKIPAIGVALSHAYEAPKPTEFGQVGAYWETIGWRINVKFTRLHNQIRPVEHMAWLGPYLPAKYSPLQPSGAGLQSIYLTRLGEGLAGQLIDIIGTEARAIQQTWMVNASNAVSTLVGQAEWEEHQIDQIKTSTTLTETEKQSVVLSRRGQGVFRSRVAAIEKSCRVTGAANLEYLRASHAKPWRDATNEERLDGENGLLLTPDADFLFAIAVSFRSRTRGRCWSLLWPIPLRSSRWEPMCRRCRTSARSPAGQRKYLDYHRENVFLEAKLKP